MTTSFTLPRDLTLPPAQDYAALRSAGLALIERLAKDLWSDYNPSDPGITLLEALCYALTDLGYRSAYPIADILASNSDSLSKAFFEAAEILPGGATTMEDQRAVLLDDTEIRNAWSEKQLERGRYTATLEFTDPALNNRNYLTSEEVDAAGIGEMEIVDPRERPPENPFVVADAYRMQLIFPFWQDLEPVWRQELTITNISVETGNINATTGGESYNYQAEVTVTATEATLSDLTLGIQIDALDGSDTSDTTFKDVIKQRLESESSKAIFQEVNTTVIVPVYERVIARDRALSACRALCERMDVYQAINPQHLGVEGRVIIAAAADQEAIAQQIVAALKAQFNPSAQFQTVAELQAVGMRLSEIYQGPLLDRGVLTQQELTRLQPPRTITAASVIDQLLQVPGVIAIENLVLVFYAHGQIVARSSTALELGKDYDKATFESDYLYLHYERSRAADTQEESVLDEENLPLPDTVEERISASLTAGRDRAIADYVSLQNDFPLVYGIGKAGLAASQPPLRQAQAKQLKAYLAVFEQWIADYLAQLREIKTLFAVNRAPETLYACQLLDKAIPHAEGIFDDGYTVEVLETIAQQTSGQSKAERQQQLLAHLLARHGQPLVVPFAGDADENQVKTQYRILEHYPALSAQRGEAMNLLAGSWNTTNLAGLQRRLYRLLGIADLRRKDLISGTIGSFSATEGFYLLEHSLFLKGNGFIQLEIPDRNNPYAFQISYVLPQQAGYFQNTLGYKIIEETLRGETPAHILPYVHWLGNVALKDFQTRYKAWLEVYIPWYRSRYTAEPLADTTVQSAQNALVEDLNMLFSPI